MHKRRNSAQREIIPHTMPNNELIRVHIAIRESYLPSTTAEVDVAAAATQRTECWTRESTRGTPLRPRDSPVECNEGHETYERQRSRARKADRTPHRCLTGRDGPSYVS